MSDCEHGKEKLVVNRCCYFWACITSFQLALVHFESLRILVQLKDLHICIS